MSEKDLLPSTRIELFLDNQKKWRWRLISKATIRIESSQNYVSKQGCQIALSSIKSMIAEAETIEI